MATLIQLRRGTAQQWFDANPILHAGEIGLATDTSQFKIGDGTTHWNDLPYGSITEEQLGIANGIATLDSNGFIPTSQLPPLAKVTVHAVTDQADRLSLQVEPGDIAIQSTDGTTYVLRTSPASVNGNWSAITVADPFPTHSTDDLQEGDTNLYFTEQRAITAVTETISQAISDNALGSTDDLTEGTSNLYFTNERAQDAVGNSVGTGLSYNDSAGSIGVNPAEMINKIIDPVSGSSNGIIGSSTYLDVKTTNGYNKEIELDIAAVESKLDTDGYAKGQSVRTTDNVTFNDVTVSGDLVVNGTTTTVNSTTVEVADKNIVLGKVASPTDTTANGGGITVKGATDKTLNFSSSDSAWTSSENLNLASGKTFKIAGTTVLSSSAVLGKSIGGTSAGDIVSIDATQTLTNKTFSDDTVISSATNSTTPTDGALVVEGGVGIGKDLHVHGIGHFGDDPTVTLDHAVAYFDLEADAAVQVGLQNSSSGTSASGDFVVTSDVGNDTSGYIDLGINNSNYADSDFSATASEDGYLIVDGGDLVLDAATGGKGIVFAAGGTQSTDIIGKWDETELRVDNTLAAQTDATVGGDLTVTGDISGANITGASVSATAATASDVPATIKGHSSQTADLQQWKNSAGTVLSKVGADGTITATKFVGTNVGNLSFYGINNTGSAISKGAPVYLTGLDTGSGNPTIALANVADPAKMPAAGVAAETIANGDTGEIILVGQLHGVDTSSWTYNAILYVDGLGTLTATKPTNASHSVQPIGNVEKVATALNGGTILINCTGTFADVPNTISVPGNITTTSGTFTGNGSGLTNLNASNLSSGTVPSAQLSLSASDIPSITHSKISDFQTTVQGYTLDTFAKPAADVDWNNYKITNLATPTSAKDAANKAYVDNLSSGLHILQAVNWATNAILPNTPTYHDGTSDQSQGLGIGAYLEGATNTRLVVDGNNVTTGQRVLVKNQATQSHNGFYYVTEQGGGGNHWILTRSTDANNSVAGQLRKGTYVSVLGGSNNINTSWVLDNDGTATTPTNGIKIGTDNVTFIQFNGAASYVAGGGMTLTGTTFDIGTADSGRIVVNADNIDLATVTQSNSSGTAGINFAQSVTVDTYGRVTGVVSADVRDATTSVKGIASFDSGDFAVSSGAVTIKTGGVDNAQLANSKVTIGSTDVSLGATASSLSGLSSVSATTFTGDLTGSVSGNASTVTNGVYTTDTGTVTNTMLAGSIADSKLSTISTSGKVSNSATTATQANTANAIVARDSSGNFTANIITADLSGNASTATTATTATNATNVTVSNDTSTNSDQYITWVDANTGNVGVKVTSSKLTVNPSTGLLKASALTTTGNVVVGGDLTVNGTTTTVNSTTLTVTDKNIELANVETPTDLTADGAGITIKATNDKTFNYVNSNTSFTSSENLNLASGKTFKIDGTDVLSGSALGSGITGSSLTSVGTIASGTWNGSVIGDSYIDSAISRSLITYLTVSGTSRTIDSSTDKFNTIVCSSSDPVTISIPTDASDNWPVGSYVNVRQMGTGQITVAAVTSGTTSVVATDSQFKTRVQYSEIVLEKTAANTWLVAGDTSA